MSESRPLIGVTTRHDPGKVEFYLQRYYPEAVYAAGGLPLLIPLIDSPEYLDSVMEKLDGMVFCGSATDVDPKHYGQAPSPHLGPVNPLRDAVDMRLAREALQQRMPIFAICYGFQMLNVTMGGTLVQDLSSQGFTDIEHERTDPGEAVSKHLVQLTSRSLLESLARGAMVQVNSSHHQAIDRLAADLTAVATSPDSLVEAAVHRSGLPVLGVQWHPERSFAEDDFSRRLFGYFVKLCKEFRTAKNAKSAKKS